ncbi:MAG TPA: hypothetical protein VM299_06065 [Solirubrobacteraceae bacterium]|nr:hypothetical protein [Solirubrobacteraceae bacterium]
MTVGPLSAIAALVAAVALLAACGGDERTRLGTTTAPAPPLAGLELGIGEQGSAMFADPRFRALGIRRARLVTAYDTVAVRFERDLVDVWLRAARAAGVEPFIAFWHSRVQPRRLPGVEEFRAAFRAFRARYPDVRLFSAWNEPNHPREPTRRAPKRAAELFNVVRAECPGCTVLAGDLIDLPGMGRYLAEYRRHLDGSPQLWGLHNYADANRFRDSGLRELLATVPGDVWLTETGGLVRFGRAFPHDEQRAARAVSFVLRLAREHERVKRLYLYNWTAAEPDERFDSGLTGLDGRPRPAYERLRAALRGAG